MLEFLLQGVYLTVKAEKPDFLLCFTAMEHEMDLRPLSTRQRCCQQHSNNVAGNIVAK